MSNFPTLAHLTQCSFRPQLPSLQFQLLSQVRSRNTKGKVNNNS